MPDRLLGQEVAAAVVLKPAARATAEELRDHVKARVAAYKYPPGGNAHRRPPPRGRPARSSSVRSSWHRSSPDPDPRRRHRLPGRRGAEQQAPTIA
ncbi:hypothetical protein AB0D10_45100 [Kitasatospora sp. NPDC048545]|uniref:AMP-binding enzyme n=1 Tax=Kitasatospora sp. NPDC048545 TaxID=3157208 RepID=UPI0033CBE5FD